MGWAIGQGTIADQQQAYGWFLEAAKYGESSSQFEVAQRLIAGKGADKNLVLAESWLIVLKANQQEFQPEDWKQIQAVITSTEKELDSAGKQSAEKQSREWIGITSKAEMRDYAKQ